MRLALPHYSQEVNTVRQLVEGHYYWTAQYYARFNNAELRRSIFDWENPWHRQFEKKYVYLEAEEVRLRAESDKKITFPVQAFGRSIIIINTDGLVRQKTLKNFRLAEEVIRESHVSFGVKKRSVLLKPLKIISRKFLEVILHNYFQYIIYTIYIKVCTFILYFIYSLRGSKQHLTSPCNLLPI
ncbi:uncharacterized protein LOC124356230 [Homalodisca vitripennis]|uniref:uncharacterized protein LOC124356230 n=1 Tax=Homalodisca vitripennis TaxID=197043 RepID=UPI001EE9CF83|nr:uncharacterized protein LOC124356230 [Homalodisca vitripennis]